MLEAQETTKSLDKALVIGVLLEEYKSVHQRVLKQVEQYESTNVKMLALLGILFFYGMDRFGVTSDWFTCVSVNAVFILLVPLLAFSSLMFAAAHIIKVMMWGDFLKTVENKVNRVLKDEAEHYGFSKANVMSWEYWRVTHGYAGSNFFSAVSFPAVLVVCLLVAAPVSMFLRLRFLKQACADTHSAWTYAACAMALLGLGIAFYSSARFKEQRKRSLEGVMRDDTV